LTGLCRYATIHSKSGGYGWAEVRIHEYGSRMVMEDALMAISPPDIDPEDVSAEDSVTLVYEIED